MTLMTMCGVGVLVLFLVASYPQSLSNVFGRDFHSPLMLFAGLGPLAISWLAVSVFKHDGSASKVKFLADRGVSPSKIWFSRHAIPFAISTAAVAGYAILVILPWDTDHGALRPGFPLIGLAALMIYAVSQFASQILQGQTISVIAAPIASVLIVMSVVNAVTLFGAPLWLIALVALLPMVATYWMMPRYIDSRSNWKSWCLSALVVAAVIFLPMIPGTLSLWSAEGMTSARRSELRQQVTSIRQPNGTIVVNLVRETISPSPDISSDAIPQWLDDSAEDTPIDFIPTIEQVKEHPGAWGVSDGYWQGELILKLQMERIRFERAADPDEAWQRYSEWLDASAAIARVQRNSIIWNDHELADRLEIWLENALSSDSLNPFRDSPEFTQLAERLLTKSARRQARRRAVLASWERWNRLGQVEIRIGRIDFQDSIPDIPPGIRADLVKSRGDAIVETALQALDAPSDIAWRKRMHRLVNASALEFNAGPYGDRMRDVKPISTLRAFSKVYPCQYWGQPWEDNLERIEKHRRSSKNAPILEDASRPIPDAPSEPTNAAEPESESNDE